MRIGLIGLGMVSQTYGDAIANSDHVQLISVYARSSAARQAFINSWPQLGAVAADTVEDIADSNVDFVILATPPNARSEAVRILAQAGKPILMEKPVERTLAGATALVEICEETGVPLGIVLQHRMRPVVAELHRVTPTLGSLRAVEVNVPWWRPQSYYDEPGRGSYARDGGGVLISQAIHTLDLMLSLTGPVKRVQAMAHTTDVHQMEAEDYVTAALRFRNGAAGSLIASTASFPGDAESITLHFTNCVALLKAGELHLTWRDGRKEQIGASATTGGGADPMAFTHDWHRDVIADFAEAFSEDRPPMVTGREALEVHALIDAVLASSNSGAAVVVSGA